MIGTASNLIPEPRPVKRLLKEEYRTNDIVGLVQHVVKVRVGETAKFARQFTADVKGLRKLYQWCDRHIRYKADPAENQWVQSPAWLNKSQEGDCKSITALQSTVMTNLGVDHIIRYVGYSAGELTHVYPVAIIDGREVPMDVVWKKQEGGPFGAEKPYNHKRDYRMKGLYQLGSTRTIPANISGDQLAGMIGQMETQLADIQRAAASIPDLVRDGWGDVTRMTKGQADRLIMADRYGIQAKLTKDPRKRAAFQAAVKSMRSGRVSGIHGLDDELANEVAQVLRMADQRTAPAVQPIEFTVPGFPPLQPGVSGFFKNLWKKAKNVVKKVGEAVGTLFKKFTNWIFKGAAQAAGPFFLYKFLKRDKIKSPKIRQRLADQDRSYDFIQKIGKFEDRQLKGLMLNGVLKNYGKSPEAIAKEAGAPQVAGLAALVPIAVKAIEWVVKIVGKIVSIFKSKSTAGPINEATMSDPLLLEEEARLQREALSKNNSADGGSNTLLLAAAAAGLALKFI